MRDSMRRWLSWLAAWLLLGLPLGPAQAAGVNYQGLWWNPPESGWGINFAHQGEVIFATWFTYNKAGEPWWLIAELRPAAGAWSGNVWTVTGPAFNAVPFDPAKVATTAVGTMNVTFASPSQASLAYTVNGVTQTKPIIKQVFGEEPTCVWGEQANLALATNYQDLWWNPAESGWGVNFTHQSEVIFATWFTYDGAGKPWWLIAELRRTGAGVYGGKVSTVKGPAFDAVPFETGKVVVSEVGEATATFADGNHATFAYTVNGVTQSKQVTRQVFAGTGTVCSAVPVKPPLSAAEKRKDAARFLRQATFGVPREAIDALVAQGYEAWLEQQFAMPMVSHLESYKAVVPTLTMVDFDHGPAIRTTLFEQRFEGDDQLRQRVADALLQVFVVSMVDKRLQSKACATPAYLDSLNRGAFGNFRDLLKEVTLSPAMGMYLSMKQSAKSDPVGQTHPDENYPREVMQLFTVGLVMLNEDGTVTLGTDNRPIPTFNEDTVKGYAKALSGWTLDYNQSDPYNWIQTTWLHDPKASTAISLYCEPWSKPMAPWLKDYTSWDRQRTLRGPAHDQGVKQLMDYPGARATSIPAGQTPQADLENVLDNLFYHPNVGPFIGKQLIQRLVTSNPSPQYVARIARKFNDNGSGVRGDMKAVVRTILLDDEARSLSIASQPTFGKLTEPSIRFLQYFRVFKGRPAGYDWVRAGFQDRYNQQPLGAPSVFNFYRPGYSPTGSLSQAGLAGPEFEITHAASIAGYANALTCFMPGYGGAATWARCVANDSNAITPDYAYYLGLTNTPARLVDELDLVFCAVCLDPNLKVQIAQAVERVTTGQDFWGFSVAQERLFVALWLILNSPDYLVQK